MATTPENLTPNPAPLAGTKASPPTATNLLPELEKFLNVTAEQYDACVTHVDHDYVVDGTSATIRLHYVRLDGNGRPKFKELAQVLAQHLGYYAVMAQRHSFAKTHADHVKIFLEAKKLLRRYAKSGEPGELLLYFLIEAVLKAPQAICKMSLKTNRKEEVKGSDGVHLRWDDEQKRLILYFGEAKLHKNLSSALTDAFRSIEAFQVGGAENYEVFLASNHFNLTSAELKEQACAFLDKTASPNTYEAHHACLIGFDWSRYNDLDDPSLRRAFISDFEKQYKEHGAAIQSALSVRFNNFMYRHHTFEFFFIPFRSVQQFREWFMDEVFGEVSK